MDEKLNIITTAWIRVRSNEQTVGSNEMVPVPIEKTEPTGTGLQKLAAEHEPNRFSSDQ